VNRARRDICAGLLLAASLAGAAGCGLTRGIAVRSFTPVLDASIEAAYADRDLATVEAAIPSNLLLLRGLVESDPGNDHVRALTVQTYFSYAMGFVEDADPARADLLYQEGLRIGLEGLSRRGWFREAEKVNPLPPAEQLRRADEDDVPLLCWTLASWTSWISLHLDRPEAVAQLPRVEAYLGRLLEIAPGYFHGMPHVLAGAIQTFRPKMLGGDPESGRAHFEEAGRLSQGRILLFRVLYARYYCRQTLDEACFDETLRAVLEAPENLSPENRLLNEVARRKALSLQARRDEFF